MMIRLKRLDALLLAAFFLTSAAILSIQFMREKRRPHEKDGKPAVERQMVEQETRRAVGERGAVSRTQKLMKEMKEDPELAKRLQFVSIWFLMLAVCSIFCLVLFIVRIWKGRPLNPRPGLPPVPLWKLSDIGRLVLIVLAAGQSALLFEWALIRSFKLEWMDRNMVALLNTLLADLIAFGGGVYWLRKISPSVTRGRLWPAVRFGMASYFAFLPLFIVLTAMVVNAMQAFKIEPEPQAALTMLLSERRAAVIWWLSLLVAVGGPVAEEFFFRGLCYTWLRSRIGVWGGLFLSAAVFATLHGNLLAFLPILALGVLFGWVYEQTGTLAAPIAMHVFHNTGMLIVASVLKDAAVSW
ncbi:MAG: CPBP family intramembrane metalloprotease [Candidatus Omnitrophica bacterium]|nr:CPBP family intramembrane metalloprotease [Candidatus Omnitrophota bacterium]